MNNEMLNYTIVTYNDAWGGDPLAWAVPDGMEDMFIKLKAMDMGIDPDLFEYNDAVLIYNKQHLLDMVETHRDSFDKEDLEEVLEEINSFE